MPHASLTVQPFELPLDAPAFRKALRAGQGRALMQVRTHGIGGLTPALIEACRKNLTWDPQCEDDRTDWLLDLIDAGKIEGLIAPEVIDALRHPPEDRRLWDALQLCGLAAVFARRNHPEARNALYAALTKHTASADLIAAAEIIDLDGTDGLLHVAETLGTWLQADPTITLDDAPLAWYDTRHAEGSGRRILETLAPESTTIAVYLRHLDERTDIERQTIIPDQLTLNPQRSETRHWQTRACSVTDIVVFIEGRWPQDRCQSSLAIWGRHARPAELIELADRFFQESDPERLWQYLKVFQRQALPHHDERFVNLADNTSPRIRKGIMRALAEGDHPEVRQLALRCVEAGRVRDSELRLFARHYQSGDHLRIEAVLDASETPEVIHDWALDLSSVFKHQPHAELQKVMLFVYEHSPCSNCRSAAVKAMIQTGLPAWVREECRFDANELIQERVENA